MCTFILWWTIWRLNRYYMMYRYTSSADFWGHFNLSLEPVEDREGLTPGENVFEIRHNNYVFKKKPCHSICLHVQYIVHGKTGPSRWQLSSHNSKNTRNSPIYTSQSKPRGGDPHRPYWRQTPTFPPLTAIAASACAYLKKAVLCWVLLAIYGPLQSPWQQYKLHSHK